MLRISHIIAPCREEYLCFFKNPCTSFKICDVDNFFNAYGGLLGEHPVLSRPVPRGWWAVMHLSQARPSIREPQLLTLHWAKWLFSTVHCFCKVKKKNQPTPKKDPRLSPAGSKCPNLEVFHKTPKFLSCSQLCCSIALPSNKCPCQVATSPRLQWWSQKQSPPR